MSQTEVDDRAGLAGALEEAERADEGRPDTPAESLVRRAANGETLAEPEYDALTAFFLGDRRKRPGETPQDEKELDVEIGPPGTDAELWRIKIRPISWEEWQTAQRLGVTKKRGEEELDLLKIASYTCAYGIISPDLGAIRLQVHEDTRPPDTAAMLRDFFRHNSGVLLQLRDEVLRISRLTLNESAVREVDAAKS